MSLDPAAAATATATAVATDDARYHRHLHHRYRHKRPSPSPRQTPANITDVDTLHPVQYTGSVAVNCHDQMARVEFVRNLMAKHRKEVLMAHGLKRVSYATCDPGCKQFCFLARQPGGHINKQYCHLFVTKTAEQAEGLNSIVGNAFRMAYAAQLELERRSLSNSPNIKLNNSSWVRKNDVLRGCQRSDLPIKTPDKLNVQRIQNGSPLSKKLADKTKPIPPKTLPGVRPFDHGKGLDITPGQLSTPTSSDDSPDLNTYKRMLDKPPLIKRLAMGLSVHTNSSNEDWYPLVCSSSVSSSPSTNSDDCSTPESPQDKLKDNRVTQCNMTSPVLPNSIKLKHNMISNGTDKTPTPPPLPERSDSLLEKPEECELKKAPWFQAGIPREITLEVLSQEPVGAFMVRESTTKPGCFALSLRVPHEFHHLGIAHYLIIRTNKGFKIKGFTKEFTTLTALITHHSVMPELLPCPLSLSRYNPTFVKSDSNQDFADIDADPDYNTLADFRKVMADLNV
ncbi:EGFR adapter protein-like isoform X3 [Adelges cooleyi]|uniref:EGFR adapter protein-like isoform X3 n=1 Tax=Adelges cooleyi TaxID=133065 RepID=UPI0021808DA8|nr:EGFR adapter protein-like isoform X3 [Adelges cooleyi]